MLAGLDRSLKDLIGRVTEEADSSFMYLSRELEIIEKTHKNLYQIALPGLWILRLRLSSAGAVAWWWGEKACERAQLMSRRETCLCGGRLSLPRRVPALAYCVFWVA